MTHLTWVFGWDRLLCSRAVNFGPTCAVGGQSSLSVASPCFTSRIENYWHLDEILGQTSAFPCSYASLFYGSRRGKREFTRLAPYLPKLNHG